MSFFGASFYSKKNQSDECQAQRGMKCFDIIAIIWSLTVLFLLMAAGHIGPTLITTLQFILAFTQVYCISKTRCGGIVWFRIVLPSNQIFATVNSRAWVPCGDWPIAVRFKIHPSYHHPLCSIQTLALFWNRTCTALRHSSTALRDAVRMQYICKPYMTQCWRSAVQVRFHNSAQTLPILSPHWPSPTSMLDANHLNTNSCYCLPYAYCCIA